MDFFKYCKEIKRIKEKEFKLKSKNFEEENLKARDRYYKSLYEKEGREYTPSYFDVDNQNENVQEEQNIEENLENMFTKSLDNHILLDRKESRLKQIESMSAKDESRALNVLN